MDKKQMLQAMIDTAWVNYNELHEAEAATGYDDAMDGFERKEAEGFAMGLEEAFALIYDEPAKQNIEPDFHPEEAF